MKAANGSFDAGLITPCDLCMEPVSNSLAGVSLAGVSFPLLILKSPKMLNTKITAAKMLTKVLRTSRGTAKRFRIVRP